MPLLPATPTTHCSVCGSGTSFVPPAPSSNFRRGERVALVELAADALELYRDQALALGGAAGVVAGAVAVDRAGGQDLDAGGARLHDGRRGQGGRGLGRAEHRGGHGAVLGGRRGGNFQTARAIRCLLAVRALEVDVVAGRLGLVVGGFAGHAQFARTAAGLAGDQEPQVRARRVAVDEQHRAAAQRGVDVGVLGPTGRVLRNPEVAPGVVVGGAVPGLGQRAGVVLGLGQDLVRVLDLLALERQFRLVRPAEEVDEPARDEGDDDHGRDDDGQLLRLLGRAGDAGAGGPPGPAP